MLTDSEISAAFDAIEAGSTASELETDQLEFKRDASGGRDESARLIAREAIALANTRGGTLVLGVDDRSSGPDAFRGTELAATWLKQRIFELSEPRLTLDVRGHQRRGAGLLVISVPEAAELHADRSGRAFWRVGAQTQPMSPADQRRQSEDRRGADWSDGVSRRSRDAISREALATARRLLGAHDDADRKRIATRGDAELLRAVGASREDGRLTRAGEVLFCGTRDDQPRIVYTHAPTPSGEPDDIVRFSGPALIAFEAVLQSVAARRRLTPLTFPDGLQVQLEDLPLDAVREAISNAIVHRDYLVTGPTRITHSPQALAVSSPGPLVAGVTPANILTHEPKPRNLRLARAARILGLAEEIGRGVDRMYRAMLALGKDPPRIDTSADAVRVTFDGGAPSTRVAAFVRSMPTREGEDVDALIVLSALLRARTVNAPQLAPLMQRPATEAQDVLHRLSLDPVAVVEPTRGTARRRHPSYRLREHALRALGSAVGYTRRSEDEMDRKVVAHVREYGHITNRTVRNLFDLDVNRARDILADMVRREIIVKTSKAQRGPSVEYGPGPDFPKQRGRRR